MAADTSPPMPSASLMKRAAARLPSALFLPGYFLWSGLRDLSKQASNRRRLKLRGMDELDLASRKKSDTIFLLGSGPSVNQISERRWETIRKHDSIGLNFWLYHRFVPDLYFFETFEEWEWPDLHRRFYELTRRRAADYAAVPKIVTRLEFGTGGLVEACPPEWRESTYALSTYTIAARSDAEFGMGLRALRAGNAFSSMRSCSRLFKYASSMTSLIVLASRLRYRRIVLCGVDLHRNDYFFQDAEHYPAAAGFLQGPVELKTPAVADSRWLVPFPKVLRHLNDIVLKPLGIELVVESRRSALWPDIPELAEGILD